MSEWDADHPTPPRGADSPAAPAPAEPSAPPPPPDETPTQRRIRERRALPKPPQPVCSIVLIAINVAVYLYGMYAAKLPDQMDFLIKYALIDDAANGQWWRMFTAGFLHFGFEHIAMNMIFLYQVGRMSERALGWKRFLILYFLSLFGSSFLSFAWHAWLAKVYVSAGASGAEMGMYFGFTGFALAVRKRLPPGAIQSVIQNTIVFVVINGVAGAIWGFDNAAHAGGGIVGFALGFGFGLRPPLHEGLAVKLRFAWAALILLGLFGADLYFAPTARVNAARYAADGSLDPFAQVHEKSAIEDYNKLVPLFKATEECLKKPVPQAEGLRRFNAARDGVAQLWANPDYQQALKVNADLHKRATAMQTELPQLRTALCFDDLDHLTLPLENDATTNAAAIAKARADLQSLEAWPEFQAELKINVRLRAKLKLIHQVLDNAPPS